MLHLLAWNKAVDNTANTDLTPVPDPVINVQNSHFMPATDVNLYWAAVMAATLTRAKWASPKTRVVTDPYIRPIIEAVIPPSNPGIAMYLDAPFRFRGLEEIQLLITDGIGTTEKCTGLALIGSGLTPAPQGDYYRLRFTSTTAVTANAWSQLTVTWEDTLPAGTYAVTGIEHQSTGGQACRLIFNGQQFRPGAPSITALSNRQHDLFYSHKLGVLGNFVQTAMPIPEVLANSADAAHEGYLECVRVG
jgi:hypothetical protein